MTGAMALRSVSGRGGAEVRQPLDAESRAWWHRLHAAEPVRSRAIAELHARLRREARFHIHLRVGGLAEFPRSDIDDLAVQAADDALMVLLRKLEDYRGDSQFWVWARRFVQIEAPVSIRRRVGHDPLGLDDPERALAAAFDPASSCQDQFELRQALQTVCTVIHSQLTERQRTVLIAIAINGEMPDLLASDLDTTRGAIYKVLHDARVKLRTSLGADATAPQPERVASIASRAAA